LTGAVSPSTIADTHFSVGKYLDPCCQKDMGGRAGGGGKEGGQKEGGGS